MQQWGGLVQCGVSFIALHVLEAYWPLEFYQRLLPSSYSITENLASSMSNSAVTLLGWSNIPEDVLKVLPFRCASLGKHTRITAHIVQVVSGILFSVSMLAAITRTTIRIRLTERLQIDDGFLFLACICSIATIILLYKSVPDIYLFGILESDPTAIHIPANIIQDINWLQRSSSAYLFVTWVAIFAVKFSFLAFFRRLISRLENIILYWKVVVGVTAAAFVFCACDGFIDCTKTGISAGTSTSKTI